MTDVHNAEIERWELRFSAPGYLFGTAPNAFLKSKAALLRAKAPGKALAIADGEGRNGVFMAEQGLDVVSMDSSAAAQEKARKLAAERGVTLRIERGDLKTWPWHPEEYDVVAGIFFQFLRPELRAATFAAMKRALKPGGLLLIEGYTPRQLQYKTGGPSQVDQLYTRDLLEAAFGDLSSLEIKEYDAMVDEGAGHSGMSALIDLVGTK
jgi:cyclopropane fatty-acyl-phospholipid synthase-like methyltransferase